jgi:hypothetical protein
VIRKFVECPRSLQRQGYRRFLCYEPSTTGKPNWRVASPEQLVCVQLTAFDHRIDGLADVPVHGVSDLIILIRFACHKAANENVFDETSDCHTRFNLVQQILAVLPSILSQQIEVVGHYNLGIVLGGEVVGPSSLFEPEAARRNVPSRVSDVAAKSLCEPFDDQPREIVGGPFPSTDDREVL